MLRPDKYIARNLSVRLSLLIVLPIAILFMASLFVMLYYARQAVRHEAEQKALQTLEGTVQQIDNILLSVEQAAGNIYWNLMPYLSQPDQVRMFSHNLVQSNPYIVGCAIAFEPGYYQQKGEDFMAYYHRTNTDTKDSSAIIQSHSFGDRPYHQQSWYADPIKTGKAVWLNPLKDIKADCEPIMTFSLPIYGTDGQRVGVLAADIALSMLSKIVLAAKPSPNAYCTLLDADGSYIVYPDKEKLMYHKVTQQYDEHTDPTLKEAAQAMLSGETGSRFFLKNGQPYHVFYKPFQRTLVPGRSDERLGWSVGIVYPEDDIFRDYNHLYFYMLSIAMIALLLLFVLCWVYTRRQLLPLRALTQSAQHIANGHYHEPIPDSKQQDEIGHLQRNFQQMQQSLSQYIGHLEQLTVTLQQQGEEMSRAYDKAQEADRMKTRFLHTMTNQMVAPASTIDLCVKTLSEMKPDEDPAEINRLADEIQQQGTVITQALNNQLDLSNERPEERAVDGYE